MKSQIRSLFVGTVFTLFAGSAAAQDHGHLNIGAVGTNQNDQLTFDNGSVFVTSSGYVKTLDYTNGSTYAGYFQGNITLTGLARTPAHLGPKPNAPALGSQLHAQLVAVEGPPGGAFAFWDTGAAVPTISLASGATGTNTFRLSENDGSPGADPYGHIHGRRFTATQPGIYTVSLRAFDYSTNGMGGGPIHTPSAVIKIYFQAGVNIKSIEPAVTFTRVTYGARAGFVWQVQASDSLPGGTNWQNVGSAITGDDYFREIQDDQPVAGQRFYRVSGTVFVP